jgi:hypothetical protein
MGTLVNTVIISWPPELILASQLLCSMKLAMDIKFVFCRSRTSNERWKLTIKLLVEKQVDNMWIVSGNERQALFHSCLYYEHKCSCFFAAWSFLCI